MKAVRVIGQLYSYQLGFGLLTGLAAVPVAAVCARVAPDALPWLLTAWLTLTLALSMFAFADIQDRRIEPFGEADIRLSTTELFGLLVLSLVGFSGLLAVGTAAAVVATRYVGPDALYVVMVVVPVDLRAYQRYGLSVGMAPVLAVLLALHVAGRLTRVDRSRLGAYGQRPRPR